MVFFWQKLISVLSLCFTEELMLFHRRSRRAGPESRRCCDHGGAGGHRMVQRNLQGIYWLLPHQLRQNPGELLYLANIIPR